MIEEPPEIFQHVPELRHLSASQANNKISQLEQQLRIRLFEQTIQGVKMTGEDKKSK
jgi:DNA-binding transcriptional LysR family regulator